MKKLYQKSIATKARQVREYSLAKIELNARKYYLSTYSTMITVDELIDTLDETLSDEMKKFSEIDLLYALLAIHEGNVTPSTGDIVKLEYADMKSPPFTREQAMLTRHIAQILLDEKPDVIHEITEEDKEKMGRKAHIMMCVLMARYDRDVADAERAEREAKGEAGVAANDDDDDAYNIGGISFDVLGITPALFEGEPAGNAAPAENKVPSAKSID